MYRDFTDGSQEWYNDYGDDSSIDGFHIDMLGNVTFVYGNYTFISIFMTGYPNEPKFINVRIYNVVHKHCYKI